MIPSKLLDSIKDQARKLKHRRSIRLNGYDYSQGGAYFVTICTYQREWLFGKITHGEMKLNNLGEIVRDEWLRTSEIRPNVILDEYVIMPNHLHGIIIIKNDGGRGTLQCAPTVERFGKPTRNSIPTIVRLLKSTTTKHINEFRKMLGFPVWQRNYYEHIIRNERDLNRIRKYIINNPSLWLFDGENPDRIVEIKQPNSSIW